MGYVVLGSLILFVTTSGGMGVSFDSERYLLMTHYFEEGSWVKAFNPVWPPLYPAVVALVSSLGFAQLTDAARLVSLLGFSVSILLVFFLGYLIQGRTVAHLSALLTSLLAPLVFVFSYCWSETLYMALSLACLLMLTLYLKRGETKQRRYIVWAGLFAGLGFATRYFGFSLLCAGGLVVALWDHDQKWGKIKRLILFALVASLPMLANFLFCLFSLGTVTREVLPARFSLPEQIAQLFVTIHNDFLTVDLNFQKYRFLTEELSFWKAFRVGWFWLSKIVVGCFFAFVVLAVRLSISSKSFREKHRLQKGVALYIVVYALVFVATASTVLIEPIGSRFLAPLYPCIILLIISSFIYFMRQHTDRVRSIASWGGILVLLLLCSIQVVSLLNIAKGVTAGSLPAMEHPGNLNRPSLKYLQANAGPKDLIITNIPDKMQLIWPRELTYLGVRSGELNRVLDHLLRQPDSYSFYILVCTEDYSSWFLTDAEEVENSTGFTVSSRTFGNDYVYRIEPVPGGSTPHR